MIVHTLSMLLVLAAASPPQPAAPAPAPAASKAAAPATTTTSAARGAAVVAKLKGTLIAELSKAIADKGAAGAVEVCGDVAKRVKSEVAVDGVELGRTSRRLRNPKNTPPAWVAPLLDEYERAPKEQRTPREVKLADGKVGYVEALVTAPLCLQCHGKADALAPDVKAALARRYPDDKAVGFAEGELRGLVWVELPAPPTAR